MRYPKLRELKEAITALIKGPYTSDFPRKPHTPAKRFRGRPEYSDSGCIACGACALVCPARAIEQKDRVKAGKGTRRMVLHLDECHYCGQCSALCTTHDETPPGIRHTQDFDLAGTDRRQMVSSTEEKELVLCECCGDVVTARAHLEWAARKLGPLAFSNPTLFVESLKDLGFADEVIYGSRDHALRPDRVKVLCAKCRRKGTIEKY